MLVITTPAADPNLLTIEQARAAAGLQQSDTSQDEALLELIKRVSADIHSACRIKRGAGKPPTLRQETVTETFFQLSGGVLILARRHEIELTSVSINGASQSLVDAVVHSDAGIVERGSDRPLDWPNGKVIAVYKAGFVDVPDDLVGVASDLLRLYRSAQSRDPLVKSQRVDVDGVDEVETQFWVGPVGSTSSSSGLPNDLLARLAPYRNPAIA